MKTKTTSDVPVTTGKSCCDCGEWVQARNQKVAYWMAKGHPVRCDQCQREWNERQGWGR